MRNSFISLFVAVSVVATCVVAAENSHDPFSAEWYGRKVRDASVEMPRRLMYAGRFIAASSGDGVWRAYALKSEILQAMGRLKEALRLNDSIQPLIPKDMPGLSLSVTFRQASLALTLGHYNKALDRAYYMLKNPFPDSLLNYRALACAVLYDFFSRINDFKHARKYVDVAFATLETAPLQGESYTEKERDKLRLAFYQALADIYIKEEKYDSVYAVVRKSRQIIGQDNVAFRRDNLIQLAEVAAKQGKVNIATEYYQEALDLKVNNLNHVYALLGYMRLLLNQKDFEGFMALRHRYAADLDKVPGTYFERDFAEVMRDYYIATGDWHSATEELLRIVNLGDSLQASMSVLAGQQIVDRYENQSAEERIACAEKGSRVRSWVIAALLAIICGCAVVIVVYRRHWHDCRAGNHSLGRRIEEMERRNADSLQESVESVEVKSQQLTAMTMLMGRLNEALARIQEEAGNNGAPAGERLARIRGIAVDLDREENVWKMFRTYFESVNQSFFDRLFRLCPSLTNAEVRMCAFILLNLTAKEIAILTNRSVRTVETIRHNLRKKLCINEPSEVFMRRISTASPTAFEDMLSTAGEGTPLSEG